MNKVLLLCLLLGLSLSASAESLELKPMLVFTGLVTDVRRDLDPGSLSGIPSNEITAAAVLDGRWEGVRFRYRLDANQQRGGKGPTAFSNVHLDGRLLQLRRRFTLSDRWALSVGKFNESFDYGHYAQVLNFLSDNIISGDFEDLAARATGFPMAKLSYNAERFGVDLIYSDDRSSDAAYRFHSQNSGFNRGLRQWLGVLRVNFDEINWTVLVQKPSDMSAGFGASFIYTQNAQMQWYGALFAQPGSRLPVLRNIYPDGTAPLGVDDVYTSSPYFASRLRQSRWYSRSMLGIGWTSEEQLSLRFEWLHDKNGMSPSDFSRWRQIIDFHRGIALTDRTASDLNIVWNAQALRGRQRDTFLVRVDRPLGEGFSVAFNAIVGADRSALLQSRLRYSPPGKKWDTWIDLQRSTGSTGTEFGSALARTQLQLGLRYLF